MNRIRPLRQRKRFERGYSLLEVVLAATLCTTALVPALALLRDGMSNATKIDRRQLMLVFGVSKMEEQLAIVAAGWSTGTVTGSFSSDGFASIRYSVTRSDAPADGGLTGRLMNVSTTVYYDDNGNSAMDSSEMRTTFTTKISKLATYESMAGS
jgi:hypothetical protein